MIHFSDLGLIEPLVKALAEKSYAHPTAIQAAAIPTVLKGQDLMASAQTGTGKTAAFVLPILQRLEAQNQKNTGQSYASPYHYTDSRARCPDF